MNGRKFLGSLIILAGVCLGSSKLAFADSINTAPNFLVPDQNTMINSKYNFIASFTKKSTIETFGNGWYTTKSVEKNSDYFTLNYSDVIKDKVGVIYRNIGDYEGKTLDLKITINDVVNPYSKQEPQISYGKTKIEHMHKGVQGVEQTWEYIDAETQKPVNVSGFMTINDLDYLQSIKFDKETSSKMTQIFGSADSWIEFENVNDEFRFFEKNDEGSNDDDLFATFTFTYDETSKLKFLWSYESLNFKEDMTWDKDYFDGVYFGYVAKKPAKSEINAPKKSVSDSDEVDQTENTLSDEKEHYLYKLTHSVSDEYEEFYYKKYEMLDTLEPVLNIEDIKVFNENDEDVTSFFDNNSSENKLILEAKSDVLKKPKFYGHTYTFVIQTSIKDGSDLKGYTDENGTISIPNTAKVLVDGMEKETNKVTTKINNEKPVPEVPVTPVKPTPEISKPEIPEEIVLPATGGMDMSKVYTVGGVVATVLISAVGLGVYFIKKRA